MGLRVMLSVPTTSAASQAPPWMCSPPAPAEQLKTRAADALGHDGGHLHGHARVQADVARQEELVKVARAMLPVTTEPMCSPGTPLRASTSRPTFDAEVGGRNVAQCAAVHHRCAHAVEHPHIVE